MMLARVSGVAQEVGLKYRLSEARPSNTFDPHRLLHYAAAQQKGDAAMEAIMNAYFSEALPVGDRAALAKLAPQFGIAEEQALALLESDEFTAEVRADESRVAELGISGVPFFVFDGKTAISGAQPVEAFVRMLMAG